MRTVAPGGPYYPGLERYDDAITTDLGRLFEHCVGGRHLRLIEGAQVHPELSYGSRRDLRVDRVVSGVWRLDQRARAMNRYQETRSALSGNAAQFTEA